MQITPKKLSGTKKYTKNLKQKPKKIAYEYKYSLPTEGLFLKFKEILLIIIAALSLYLFLSLLSYSPEDPGWSYIKTVAVIHNNGGKVGAWISDLLFYVFGYFSYWIPVSMLYGLYYIYINKENIYIFDLKNIFIKLTGFFVSLLSGAILSTIFMHHDVGKLLPYGPGGIIGTILAGELLAEFNLVGSSIFLISVFLIGLTLFSSISWVTITVYLFNKLLALAKLLYTRLIIFIKNQYNNFLEGRQQRQDYQDYQEQPNNDLNIDFNNNFNKQDINITVKNNTEISEYKHSPIKPAKSAKIKLSKAELPSLDLLETALKESKKGYLQEELAFMAQEVEAKLADFGVKASVIAVHPGPVIVRFELELAAGVKVSKISGLSKDIARSLSMVSVRVVEVIPGKPYVGLEVPNKYREIIRLKEVLSGENYLDSKARLVLALGKDISGNPIVTDLATMPHLLVAGTTGSGKSVGINAMLLSILFKASPEDVKLIMIDPKMLELSVYEGIPHLLAPVVTDMKDATNVLRWCVAEMERRYQLLSALGVRNIIGYNEKITAAKQNKDPILDPLWPEEALEPAPELAVLPYIVVIIDEFADMIMVVGKKVEELIARIAQKARAAGIHMIIATQRPSVDVITGLIKANIPTRIAFQVSSRIDSRTILDQQGAENLLGQGDMLFLPPGVGAPVRVHGAFVADHEVHRVVADLKRAGKPNYALEILDTQPNIPGLPKFDIDDEDAEADPLYNEAIEFILDSKKTSISALQRRFKIGYNRAARIIEHMEGVGFLSQVQSNGQREILAKQTID